MKKLFLVLLVTSGVFYQESQARCNRRHCHRSSAVAGFLGAITGATIAAAAYSEPCYYRNCPQYDFVYPGSPIYTYDYPTYVYSPVYAYPDMRYNIYPSYYFYR